MLDFPKNDIDYLLANVDNAPWIPTTGRDLADQPDRAREASELIAGRLRGIFENPAETVGPGGLRAAYNT